MNYYSIEYTTYIEFLHNANPGKNALGEIALCEDSLYVPSLVCTYIEKIKIDLAVMVCKTKYKSFFFLRNS